jgi:hypothetical protein
MEISFNVAFTNDSLTSTINLFIYYYQLVNPYLTRSGSCLAHTIHCEQTIHDISFPYGTLYLMLLISHT